jgi:DnaJ-class molecular chaperone
LILGSEIKIMTLQDSEILVTIPPGTQPGTALRIRGHGLLRRGITVPGDMFIKLQAVLPTTISPELQELIRQERDH